jgi:hypothetical protein
MRKQRHGKVKELAQGYQLLMGRVRIQLRHLGSRVVFSTMKLGVPLLGVHPGKDSQLLVYNLPTMGYNTYSSIKYIIQSIIYKHFGKHTPLFLKTDSLMYRMDPCLLMVQIYLCDEVPMSTTSVLGMFPIYLFEIQRQ